MTPKLTKAVRELGVREQAAYKKVMKGLRLPSYQKVLDDAYAEKGGEPALSPYYHARVRE